MKKISLFIAVCLYAGIFFTNGQETDNVVEPDSLDLVLTSKDSIVASSWIAGLGWNVINDSGDHLRNLTEIEDRYHAVAFPSRASIGRYFKSGLGLEFIATYNKYKEGKIVDGAINPEDKDYFGVDSRLSYDLNKLFGQTGFFDPYLGVGIGYTDANDIGRGTYNAVIGFRTWFNDRWGLDFSSSGKWSFGNEATNHMQHGIGVVYQFRIEKELSKKGEEKLALINEMAMEQQRINDSIAEAKRLEEEALLLAEQLEKAKRDSLNALASAEKDAAIERIKRIQRSVDDLGFIHFAFNSSYLDKESKNTLDQLVAILEEHPDVLLEISAHADSRGPDTYNVWLSERRAQRTLDYILDKGIPQDRVKGKGFGESQLTNECSDGVYCTEDKHRKNRRSAFRVAPGIPESVVLQIR